MIIERGDLRVLKTDQIDNDTNGNQRVTPAGSIVEALDIWKIGGDVMVGCPQTGTNWIFTSSEWWEQTLEPRTPGNPFKDSLAFRIALQLDRQETLHQFFERKVDEWLEDGRIEAVGCLARWAMDRLNLGNDEVISGLAESLLRNATMQKFEIEVVRIGYGVVEIQVDAATFEEAQRIALEHAGDKTFDEHTSEFKLADDLDESVNSDLLSALEHLLDCVRRTDECDDSALPHRDEVMKEADAAIAKAKGETSAS